VTPLGFVADDERCRDNTLGTFGWEVFAVVARVAIDGVDGDANGEFKFSLGVDGEITETVKFPAPGPFEAVVFDE
jgi:hypothetical protein